MDDLEDLRVPGVAAKSEQAGASEVVPRSRAKASARTDEIREDAVGDAFLPGRARVFVHTFGCGHNVSDGEYMAGLLAQSGYSVTDQFDAADAYVLNSCTVKGPSEDHFVNMMKKAQARGKPTIVAGCVPQADPKNTKWSGVSTVGVRHIDQVVHVVEEALRGNTVKLLGNGNKDAIPSLNIPKVRRNNLIEIVPINVGCLNHCTYCKTKHARGNLKSWPIDEICDRIRSVVDEGVLEIRLTSEDTGAYGIDIGTDIVQLLRAIVRILEGTRVMLRVGMSNPPYLLRHVEDYSRLLLHPNVYEFIHIPVQSGSNAILNTMQREYTVADFMKVVRAAREQSPSIVIGTDIICGFPGEGDKEWQETMDLCREVQFPVLNISRYYTRRETPAAAMKQVPTDVTKKRTVELTKFFESYMPFNHLVGTEESRVNVVEVATDKHHLVGHTKHYVQVLLDPSQCTMGDCVTIRVTKATRFSVFADVLKVEASIPKPHRSERGLKATNTTCGGGACCTPSHDEPSNARSLVGNALIGVGVLAMIASAVVLVRTRR